MKITNINELFILNLEIIMLREKRQIQKKKKGEEEGTYCMTVVIQNSRKQKVTVTERRLVVGRFQRKMRKLFGVIDMLTF